MSAFTAAELRARRCAPLGTSARLSAAEVSAQRAAVPDWQAVDGALQRVFTFADFRQTMAFVNALASIADAEDHHPDLQVGFGRCQVRWSTHSAAGITINDFICAAKVDALLSGDAR